MRAITFFFMVVGALLFISCDTSTEDLNPPGPSGPPTPPVLPASDTVQLRVLAYIDKASIQSHLGGSERVVKSRMNELLRKVSNYWNECSQGKLKHTYIYSLGDMVVYEGASSNQTFRNKVYNEPMDFTKYDVTVLFDCKQDYDETGNGGAACGGGKDHRSVITVTAGKDPKDIFNDATYQTLVHELGHYRGVTDLYQYIIEAKDNPVSNEKFVPDDCVMNWAAAGKWSDYAALCMNRSAGSKQIGRDFVDFFGEMYPQKIEFKVTVGGVPERGVTINIYGSRAGSATHNRDIVPQVFVWGQTNNEGIYTMYDMRKYFIPSRSEFPNLPASLPYGRWFGFLAEVTYGSAKRYVWMSEYKVQMPYFSGETVYKVDVDF